MKYFTDEDHMVASGERLDQLAFEMSRAFFDDRCLDNFGGYRRQLRFCEFIVGSPAPSAAEQRFSDDFHSRDVDDELSGFFEEFVGVATGSNADGH